MARINIRGSRVESSTIEKSSPRDSKLGTGCALLFILPFFIAGCAAIVSGVRAFQRGEENAFVGILVGTLFAGVAIAMTAGLICSIRSSKQTDRRKSQHPNQPWLWRSEWVSGELRSNGMAKLWVGFGFVLFWNSISWSVTAAAWSDIVGKGEKKVLLVLIFPAIGLCMLAWLVYSFIQHRKFGISIFKMQTNPGALGGTLQGHVEVPTQIDPKQGFKVRLLCVHRYTSGSGKSRRTREDVRWEEEKIITKDLLAHDSTRTGIPVFFNLPFEMPQSSEGNPCDIWKLHVAADLPGVDYHAEFEVPVFKTAESDPNATPAADPTLQHQMHGGEYRWPENSPIRYDETGDNLTAHFPAARNKGVLVFLFVFLLIWNGAIWFMIAEKAPLLFPIVFGLFDLFLLMFFFSSLLYSARIQANTSELTLHRNYVIPIGTKLFASADIREIKIGSGMQSGNKRYYRILLINREGKKTVLAAGIRDKKQAEWLVQKISTKLAKSAPDNSAPFIQL